MSAISGKGYGDKHDWKRGETAQPNGMFGFGAYEGAKETLYNCKNCGASFWHQYGNIPDIFEAIKYAEIPEECSSIFQS